MREQKSENLSERIPLSYAQERLFFYHLTESTKGNVYNHAHLLECIGQLNVAAFKKAVSEIAKRHEILRTSIVVHSEGEPFQYLSPNLVIHIPIVNLMGLNRYEQEQYVENMIQEKSNSIFDLSEAPLFRISLLKLSGQHYIILFVFHHIVADQESFDHFLGELESCYEAYCSGKSGVLPVIHTQYSTYARTQKRIRETETYLIEIQKWMDNHAQTEELNLPIDKSKVENRMFQESCIHSLIPRSLTIKLYEVAEKQNVSIDTLLFAAFSVLIYRYTGQDSFLMGLSNPYRGMDNSSNIGPLTNYSLIRIQADPKDDFLMFLSKVNEEVMESLCHQYIPFELLAKRLNMDLQILFHTRSRPKTKFKMRDVELHHKELKRGINKIDLALNIDTSCENHAIHISFDYNGNLFNRDTIERMSRNYIYLLQGIVYNSNFGIISQPLLSTEETDLLLHKFINSSNDQPGIEKDLISVFNQIVDRSPDKIALVFKEESMSYSVWNNHADGMAQLLIKSGVQPGDLIGICLNRSLNIMIALLAVWKAGGAYVPLDPDYPDERILNMLDASKPKFVITESVLLPRLKNSTSTTAFICIESVEGQWKEDIAVSANLPNITGNQLAYVIFTSGTTGKPKGAMIEHQSLVMAGYDWKVAFGLDEQSRILNLTSMSFDVFSGDFVKLIVSGGTLVIASNEERLELKNLYQVIAKQNITHILSTPGLMIPLLNYVYEEQLKFPNLRVLEMGGDYLPYEEYRVQVKRFGDQFRILNAYGITETTVESSAYEAKYDGIRRTVSGYVPIGKPYNHVRYYILNESLELQPIGVVGELYISGPYVGRGYYEKLELTDERFIPNPYNAEEKMYKTGDLARWLNDGNIEYFGRIDHQVKIRGHRIELGEIDATILKHPSVKDIVVMALKDDSWGNRLVAFMVPSNEQQKETAIVRNYLKNLLPSYMIPSAFIWLNSLPYTPNGKVDRTQLKRYKVEQYHEHVSAEESIPRDIIEFEMQILWEEVLGQHSINLKKNFFEAGGHSLALIQLQSKIQVKLGIEIPLSELYQNASIEEMSVIIREGNVNKEQNTVIPLHKNTEKTLLFIVHQVGGYCFRYRMLARQLAEGFSVYGFQITDPEGEHDSIVEMAAHYIVEMKKIQLHGPYFLAGHSFGGNVAFEMAIQLQAIGEEVGFITLLDPILSPFHVKEFDEKDIIIDYCRDRFQLNSKQEKRIRSENFKEQVSLILEIGKSQSYYREDMTDLQLKRVLSTHIRHKIAWFNYSKPMIRYAGETLFFVSQQVEKPSSIGWDELIDQPMEIIPVQADHHTIIEEPHSSVVAAKILGKLRTVNEIE